MKEMHLLALISTALPGMDGHELARPVATRFPDSKVVFVTVSFVDRGSCPRTVPYPQSN